MAEIPIEKKSSFPWWLILLGALLLFVVFWVIYEMTKDRTATTNVYQPTTVANATRSEADANASPIVNANGNNVGSDAAENKTDARAAANDANDNRITNIGVYASTADKLSLAGKKASFTDLRVARIVGPRTFSVASGAGEELFVIIDDSLDRGVGTQGNIGVGSTVSLNGTFERLDEKEISEIADRRFRGLTEQERATLGNTQIYLHANQFSKNN